MSTHFNFMNTVKYIAFILGIALFFCTSILHAQTKTKSSEDIENFLKEYQNDLKNLDVKDSDGNTTNAYEFVRNGIYGCKGIGEVGPVGMQHAQGTFVPVSEEAIALNTFILVNKFCVLDGLNIRQREAIVSGITRAALRQINEGRQGQAKYAQNPRALQAQLRDEVMEKFMEHESLQKMCAPYRERVKRNLVQDYVNKTRKPELAYACSFNGTDQQFRSLMGGDLENSGWGSFISSFEEGNNELSAFMNLRDTATVTIDEEQRRLAKELDWGNGFLSDRDCKQVPVGNGRYEEDCQIVTPGKVIADMTSFLVQTGHRQTEQADSIDELLGSFITNLQTEVLSGFGGLQSTTNNASGASYLDRAVDDAFGRARGETTNVGKDALQKALQTETDYNAVIKTTLSLIDTTMAALVQREDKCFEDMLDQAKKDLKKQVEDEVCSAEGGIGSCTADVTVDITDDASSTQANPKKRYKITAKLSGVTKTVTLLKTNERSIAVISSDIEPIRKVFADNLKSSDSALSVLRGLENMLKNDSSPATAQFVIGQLEKLVNGGKLHNSSHVSNARDKQSQLKDILQNLVERTQTSWTGSWCKAEKWSDLKL